jgi:hypothetical protein
MTFTELRRFTGSVLSQTVLIRLEDMASGARNRAATEFLVAIDALAVKGVGSDHYIVEIVVTAVVAFVTGFGSRLLVFRFGVAGAAIGKLERRLRVIHRVMVTFETGETVPFVGQVGFVGEMDLSGVGAVGDSHWRIRLCDRKGGITQDSDDK